ncbi:aldo/keto reductase [Bacillota bacterium Meth-B3]
MMMRRLDALDRELSALCLGTMNFGAELNERDSFEVMDAFDAIGGNFIDTARIYGAWASTGMGASEKVIGAWLRARGNRDRKVIATKGGHPQPERMHEGRLDKAGLTADLEASLRALGTDYIDLYWLHRDDTARPIEDILETLAGFIRQGKVRAVGASNWTGARLREAWSVSFRTDLPYFCADQPMWSMARAEGLADATLVQMDGDLYRWHANSRMPCVPYTAQAKGFFAKLERGGEGALSDKARARYLREDNLRLYDAARDIARETGLGVGTVAIAYLTNQAAFAAHPIVGVSSVAQARALSEAADARLTEAHMARLSELTGLIAD